VTAALTVGGALAGTAGATLLDSQDLGSLGSMTTTANPNSPVILHGTRYFVADDGDHGTELMRQTGSGPATLVKDIAPGGVGAGPLGLMTDGDALYFEASTGAEDWELFTSDGTAAGTRALTTIEAPNNNVTSLLGAFGGHVYFSKNDDANGTELWVSDGTVAGTRLLKNIAPGVISSEPQSGVVAGQQLFFTADDLADGRELWVTDGTDTGTHITADLDAGSDGASIFDLAAVGDDVYFDGFDDTNAGNGEPFVSDGTQAGTHLVATLETDPGYSASPMGFVAFGGSVYFLATTQAGGDALYATDGTSAGTTRVKVIDPGSSSGNLSPLRVAGGAMYFRADDGSHGAELWRSDGTTAGTSLLDDINPSGDGQPDDLTVAGNDLYFSADDGVHGDELWTTDGTQAGTRMVSDLNPSGSSYPSELSWDGTGLWFQADDGTHGAQPWTSDGTQAGTTSQPLATGGTAQITSAARAGAKLVAASFDSVAVDVHLVVTDGSAGGTHTLSQAFHDVEDLVSLGDEAYFQGRLQGGLAELWVTDGTDAGTHPVTSDHTSMEEGPFLSAGKLWFTSPDNVSTDQVWSSDGTDAGTQQVTDDAQVGDARQLAPYGDGVAFEAENHTGTQAWVTDGTSGGTRALTVAGVASVDPSTFGVLGGKLYFTGEGPSDEELYVSDGTTTHAIGSGLGEPGGRGWTAAGGELYYVGDENNGPQLYATDGTAAGTGVVKVLGGGRYYQSPENLTALANGKLAFDVIGTPGVWVTDGTAGGTTQLAAAAGEAPALKRVGDRVDFAGQDEAHGTELWSTDGTVAGTGLAADLVGGAGSSHPQVLGDVDGRAIALGDVPHGGSVLYAIDAVRPPPADGGGGTTTTTTTTTTAAPVAVTPATPVPAAPAPPKAPAPAKRVAPASLTLKIGAAKTLRPPFRYTVSGRLGVPKGVAKATACKGTVTVSARRGTKVVAHATAKLAKDCTYHVTVTKATNKLLAAHGGKLTLVARFAGNAVLLPSRSGARSARYGGKR
jgi:ELWxxDGT repeat protein